jgi:hypothetical protein
VRDAELLPSLSPSLSCCDLTDVLLCVFVTLLVDVPLVELPVEPKPGGAYHAAFEPTPWTLIAVPFDCCTGACTSIPSRSALNSLRSHANALRICPTASLTVHSAKPLSRPDGLAVTMCNTAVFHNAYRAIKELKARIAKQLQSRSNDECVIKRRIY